MYNNFLFWTVINIIISLLDIYILHHLWTYMKETYTVKKTKDLVNIQINKYKKIIHDLQENAQQKNSPEQLNIDENNIESMDSELTKFMESQI
jgi:hypothetical protein